MKDNLRRRLLNLKAFSNNNNRRLLLLNLLQPASHSAPAEIKDEIRTIFRNESFSSAAKNNSLICFFVFFFNASALLHLHECAHTVRAKVL